METAIRCIAFLICCVVGPVTLSAVPREPQAAKTTRSTIERRIHVNRPGPNESRYVYVPFAVGPNAARISISYQYDRAHGANTIDIGLFDARSTSSDTDPNGFRGWSGGRRAEFFVSGTGATPGYLPGALMAGTWRIILGLYQVAPAGADVTFKIDIESGNGPLESLSKKPDSFLNQPNSGSSGPGAASPPQRLSAQVERWWSGDLHMHTVHSDGEWTIADLISSARKSGLDFIVITDHNTSSHHGEIDRLTSNWTQPLVMRGEEITTYGGHTNAWGLASGTWIDFRVHPGDAARMSDIVAAAHREGALISINHPFALCGGCAWSYATAVSRFDAIEVWNGSWDETDESALRMWDQLLQTGRRMTGIASSDSHRADNPIGRPTTHVAAKVLSQASLLKAIRLGRVYLTGEAAGPVIRFEAESGTGKSRAHWMIGDELHLSGPQTIRFRIATEAVPPDAVVSLVSNGQVVSSFPSKADSQPQVVEINCARNSYFRLEIRDAAKTVLALTNPIYVKVAAGR